MLADDGVDLRDRGEACVPDGLPVGPAEPAHQIGEPGIRHHRQVGAGVTGVDLRASGALEERDRFSASGEQVRSRHSGDAAADHDNVDVLITFELSGTSEMTRNHSSTVRLPRAELRREPSVLFVLSASG